MNTMGTEDQQTLIIRKYRYEFPDAEEIGCTKENCGEDNYSEYDNRPPSYRAEEAIDETRDMFNVLLYGFDVIEPPMNLG